MQYGFDGGHGSLLVGRKRFMDKREYAAAGPGTFLLLFWARQFLGFISHEKPYKDLAARDAEIGLIGGKKGRLPA
jgi:hypothetical protein